MYKVHALQEHIRRNFPYTTVVPFPYALGNQAATLSIQRLVYNGVELILDATADRGVGFALAERARILGIPYVWVSSTEGNWGGMVINIRPGRTNACWWCLMKRLEEGSLPSPPVGPVMGVQVRGCASPTFSGAMFDSTELSLQAIRCVVGDLSTSYPQYPWDYMMLALRASNGDVIVPSWQTALLTPHPECPRFHEHLA
jgi:molybdopterin/thiamine biosynthesis adenylyltransferase